MITIKALSKDTAEILIYDAIGADWFGNGVTAKQFVDDLKAVGDVSQITVRINSPGGEVFDGLAIYNALTQHGARVDVQVDGLAASIASVIAMAGDSITMGDGAMLMIHNPWMLAMGDSADLRKSADMLDKVKVGLVDAYRSKTGIDRTSIEKMMDAETWLTAQDAVEQGFATKIVEPKVAAKTEGARVMNEIQAARNYSQQFEAMRKRFASSAGKRSLESANSSPVVITSANADHLEAQKMNDPVPGSAQIADVDTAKIEAAAVKKENARQSDIRSRFAPFSSAHRELMDECLQDTACTPDTASKRLLAALGAGSEPLVADKVSAIVTEDARDKFLKGAQNAIFAKLNLEKIEAGNEYAGLGLTDLASKSLSLAGFQVRGLTRDGIARKVLATHTTSDFPQLHSSTAGKVMRNAYENFPNTWQLIAAAGSVSDFKIHPRIQTGSFNNLATIAEGGEYTYGTLAEDYENAQAVTKGKAIALTRQMIVNDDLGGFNRRAQLMGRAAARSVNSDFYAYVTGGASNNGPTSSDTGQFFNATAITTAGGHANYTSSGTAMSIASFGVGRTAMRKQMDKGRNEVLNIQPQVLLCSVAKEDTARQLMVSETDPSSSNSKTPNIYKGAFTVVSDPYLDNASLTLPWYLFASPADIAAFEIVFLDGVQTPYVDDTIDFDTDAMKFKVRLDYGIALGDWRAGYRNAGA